MAAGLGVAGLCALFVPEMQAATHVWFTSTAFGHCFLVLPIAAWLAWDRRSALVEPSPMPAAALLMLPCAAVWLFAERLGLMEGRQLAALAMIWVVAIAAFGPRAAYAMAAPLGYLVFLVPFGAFLVPALQNFTANFIEAGLGLLAIPHFVDQVTIDIPEGRFLVAEACAGLRFLIAAIAFGTLYALLIYRSPWRRLAFIVASIVIPILANGMRALGIVLLGHIRGSAAAGAVDHVLYGWLFFSMVIVLLILLGLPFREDGLALPPPPRRAVPLSAAPREAAIAIACVLGLACLAPAMVWVLNRRGSVEVAGQLARIAPPPGCRAAPEPNSSTQVFACPAGQASVHIRFFSPQAGAGLIQSEFHVAEEMVEGEEVEHATLALQDGTWRLSTTAVPEAAVAVAVWRDGRAATGGLRVRLAQAWTSLGGAGTAPAVTTVFATGSNAERMVRDLASQVALAIGRP